MTFAGDSATRPPSSYNRCAWIVACIESLLTARCRLYIDGGLVNYNPFSQNPLNYTSMLPESVRSALF